MAGFSSQLFIFCVLSQVLVLVACLIGFGQAAVITLSPSFAWGSDLALSWENASTWDGGSVPSINDDVVIDTIPCSAGLSSPHYLSVTEGVARSVRFGLETCQGNFCKRLNVYGCNTVLLIENGGSLTVQNSFSMNSFSSFLVISDGASLVVQNGPFAMTAGVLQGLGELHASSFQATGDSHIAPGRSVFAACPTCIPGWNGFDVPGLLTIVTSQASILDGATIWIKYLSSLPPDHLDFKNAAVFLSGSSILVGASGLVPAAPTITFQSLVADSNWSVDVFPPTYYWSTCTCIICSESCDSITSTEGPGLSALNDNGASGSAACSSQSTISIITGLIDCTPPASTITTPSPTASCANMSPQCIHGVCLDKSFGPLCQCTSGNGFTFSGILCDSSVCPLNCNGPVHGACVWTSPDAVPHCQCTIQFKGDVCSEPICSPICSSNGLCVESGGERPTCDCKVGWQGDDCTTFVPPFTCPNCNGRGNCSSATNYTCDCETGYSGTSCSILSCPNSCSQNGVCVASSPPTCNCSSGWSGSSCSFRSCLTSDCFNSGTCAIVFNTATCDCPSGWTGSKCQIFVGSTTMGVSHTYSVTVPVAVGVSLGVAAIGALIAVLLYVVHVKKTTLATSKLNARIVSDTATELQRSSTIKHSNI
jgi:hypothetical protein